MGEAVVCAYSADDEKQFIAVVEGAKVYLYEKWEKAQNEFKPLIKHLGFKFPIHLSGKIPCQSMIKNRVDTPAAAGCHHFFDWFP